MRFVTQIRALPILFLFLAASGGQADRPSFDTIPLKHRNPEDILPIVERMVPGASVEVWDGRLIARGTTEDLAQIRALVTELDRVPRQWLVWVRKAGAGAQESFEAGVDASGSRIKGTLKSPSGTREVKGATSSRVLEGRPAVVRMNADEVRVEPRSRGEMVELDVSVATHGESSYRSTITVRPGIWIQVGGVNRTSNSKGSDILARRSGQSKEQAQYEVRVEPIPQDSLR